MTSAPASNSKRSAGYSFEVCIRDIDAVFKARDMDLPLLVGWSYGAVLRWHWAGRNPDRGLGGGGRGRSFGRSDLDSREVGRVHFPSWGGPPSEMERVCQAERVGLVALRV